MTNKRRLIAGILCVSMIASLAVGCSPKETEKDTTPNVKTETDNTKENERQSNLDIIRPQAYSNIEGLKPEKGSYLSIIGRASGSDYWKAVKAGAEQAVADLNATLGYKGEDKIKLNYSGPATAEDVDEQINILDEELARYPLAVGIASVDATACTVQFDLAAENDIPIVAVDSGSDYQDIQATCSTNNTDAAQTAAAKLSALIDNKGEIAVFVHDAKSTTARERETAFVEKLKQDNPDVSVVNVYHMDELAEIAKQFAQEKSTPEQTIDPAAVTQEEIAKWIFDKNPNIKGAYGTNVEATQLIVKTLDTIDKEEIKVVGFDGGTDQMKSMEDGKIDGLIVQNPYGMGYATVVASLRSVLKMGNEAFIDTGYTWVTPKNMDKETIANLLY